MELLVNEMEGVLAIHLDRIGGEEGSLGEISRLTILSGIN